MKSPFSRCCGLFLCIVILAVGLSNFSGCSKASAGNGLVGGTDWVYELDVSNFHGDTHDLPLREIEALKKRIDPDGAQNIVWRVAGDNRIEIQMPPVSPAAIAARKDVREALRMLLASNVRLIKVTSAIEQTGNARKMAMNALAAAGTPQRGALDKLAAAADARRAAEQAAAAYGDPAKIPGSVLDDLAAARQAYYTALDKVKNFNMDVAKVSELVAAAHLSTAAGRDAAKQLDAIMDKPEFADKKLLIQNLIAAYDNLCKNGDEEFLDPDALELELRSSGILDFRVAVECAEPSMEPIIEMAHGDLERKGPGKPVVGADVVQWFKIDPESGTDLATDTRLVLDKWGGENYVLLYTDADHSLTHDSARQWGLSRAKPSVNDSGTPIVEFWFDPRGQEYFGKLTMDNVHRPTAILLDDKAIQAPTINEPITGGTGEITFGDTLAPAAIRNRVTVLANILNAGSLPVPLRPEPVSRKTIGS